MSALVPDQKDLAEGQGKARSVLCELAAIEAALKTKEIGRASGFANELWETIDSTNNRAMMLAKQGAPHGVIVIARQQTAGRGRLGRTWLSPLDSGLYLSFLLRPDKFKPQIPLITLAAGYACAKAIYVMLGIKIGIKWVNDLILSGRKLGGILSELYVPAGLETSMSSENQAIIVGIGINIEPTEAEIPEEIRSHMAWLSDIDWERYLGAPPGSAGILPASESVCRGMAPPCPPISTNCLPMDRNALIAQIAFELEQVINHLSEGAVDEILNGWRQYAITLGESVIATIGNETLSGVAIDVDQSGALILMTNNGHRTLHAGEVTVRKSDGNYA